MKRYIYPKIWDEEDIVKFNYYKKESLRLFEKMPEDFIDLCCERQINEEKGLIEPIDHSKITPIDIKHQPHEIINSADYIDE